MQHYMIQIRHKSRFTHGENADGILETIIIAPELSFRGPEDRIVPMAEELDNKPQDEYPEKDPDAEAYHMKGSDPGTVQAEHNEFRAFYAFSIDQSQFSKSICDHRTQEPDPQQRLNKKND